MPRLLTINQACSVLSVSRPTLQKLITSGEVPSIMLGRSRRIPEDELAAVIAAKKGAAR